MKNTERIFKLLFLPVFVFLITLALLVEFGPKKQKPQPQPLYPVPQQQKEIAPPEISNPTPNYQSYSEIIAQLDEWRLEAPELASMGSYGKTSKGQSIYFLHIKNKNINAKRPSVLITACIHGNESHSAAIVMNYAGKLLSEYGRDEKITKLINEREIYFIPVISPDSYPRRREVKGLDPNRNFPTHRNPDKKSISTIECLKKFYLRIKPDAVISGHTSGRMILYPYGYTYQKCPDHDEYVEIVNKMASMCNYRPLRICQLYGHPINGTETDWYYANGSFGVVIEYGNHQRIPTDSESEQEFERTWDAVLYFIEKAPLVEINK